MGQTGTLLSVEVEANRLTRSPSTADPMTRSSESLPALITGGDGQGATELIVNADGSVTLSGGDSILTPMPGTVIASGYLTAAGATGGQINVLGDRIHGVRASLNASGTNAGGAVRIGGDYQGQGAVPNARQVEVDANTSIQADALAWGNGGQVIVWADETVRFSGGISARGGSKGGNGGFVETSGQQELQVEPTARVDTTATAGERGTWLLDPTDLAVVSSGGTAGIAGGTNSPATDSSIDANTIVTALNGTNVNLQATNSITVNAAINASGNANAGDLRLSTPTANLNQRITLRPGSNLSGTATTVNVGAGGSVQNGLDVTATGGTVNLAATTYREGSVVTINRNLTVQGQGSSQTIISGDSDGNGTGDHQVVTLSNSVTTLNGLTIQDGSAAAGGGIYNNNNSSLTINNSVLRNNLTDNNHGGGIYNTTTASLTILNSTLSNNSADDHGGGIYNLGTLTIDNSTFNNNQSNSDMGGLGQGGGLDNAGNATIRNSTFSGNIVNNNAGGGIYNSGMLILSSNTIANNQANTNGGGIFNTGTAQVDHTIIAGNTSATNAGTVDISGTFTDSGHNLIGQSNGTNGFTNGTSLVGTLANPINPQLGPLTNNGGPTQTHNLLTGSPAINAGASNLTGLDQRGMARVVGGNADIGAVEINPLSPVPNPPLPGPTPLPGTSAPLTSAPTIITTLDPQIDSTLLNPRELADFIDGGSNPQTNQGSVWDQLIVQLLERSFSEDYEDYWQLPITPEISLSEVQTILRRAEKDYQTRSAVIYATFVPANQTVVPNKSIIAQGLLQRDGANDDDQLLLMMVPSEGEPVQRLVDVTRQEVMQQTRLFRIFVSDPEDDVSYRPLARQRIVV
jgi:hypothetical protein